MEWALTFLVVHALLLVMAITVYKGAPCWMQRLFIAGLAFVMLVFAIGYILELEGHWLAAHVVSLGYKLEHLAVMIYLFKLVLKKDEGQWARSRAPSLNLPQ